MEAITRPDGMHLEVSGSGPPVVLTHGFGDDSSTFDAQLPALGGHSVGRWDLPGHGRSLPETEPSTRASALAWLEVAIGAAGAGPAVLVGHSLGGYLSLCRTVLDPAGVAGLVLIATGPGFRDPTKREAWNDFVARFGERQGVPASARGICAQPDSVVLDRLEQIEVPVLVVVGGDEQGSGERGDGGSAAEHAGPFAAPTGFPCPADRDGPGPARAPRSMSGGRHPLQELS